jgi:hypothetical protein
MIQAYPNPDDVIAESSDTTNSTLITVPAGRVLTANILLSAVQSGAGTASPVVTWTPAGTGAGPSATKTLAKLNVGGLLGVVASDCVSHEILVRAGDTDCHIGFTASGTSSVSINGYLI